MRCGRAVAREAGPWPCSCGAVVRCRWGGWGSCGAVVWWLARPRPGRARAVRWCGAGGWVWFVRCGSCGAGVFVRCGGAVGLGGGGGSCGAVVLFFLSFSCGAPHERTRKRGHSRPTPGSFLLVRLQRLRTRLFCLRVHLHACSMRHPFIVPCTQTQAFRARRFAPPGPEPRRRVGNTDSLSLHRPRTHGPNPDGQPISDAEHQAPIGRAVPSRPPRDEQARRRPNLAHPDKAANTRQATKTQQAKEAAPPRPLRLPLLSQATANPRIHSYPKLNGLLQTDSTRQQYPEHSRRCTSAPARRYQICTHWSRHSNMTLQIVVSRPTKLHPAFLPS